MWEDFLAAAPPSVSGAGRDYRAYMRSLLSSRRTWTCCPPTRCSRATWSCWRTNGWPSAAELLVRVAQDQFGHRGGVRRGGARHLASCARAFGPSRRRTPRGVRRVHIGPPGGLQAARRRRREGVPGRGPGSSRDGPRVAAPPVAGDRPRDSRVGGMGRAPGRSGPRPGPRLLSVGRVAGMPDVRARCGGPARRERGGRARRALAVDAEMLLQPISGRPIPIEDGEPRAGRHPPTGESCLASGVAVAAHGGAATVVSTMSAAFSPPPSGRRAVAARRWVDLRSDALAFVESRHVHPALKNDLVWGARCSGRRSFRLDLRRVRSRVSLLPRQSRRGGSRATACSAGSLHCPTRVLFRPSNQYGALLYLMAAPRYQRSGVDRSLAIETLLRGSSAPSARPARWPLIGHEQAALESLDIPRVTIAGGRRRRDAATGETVARVSARSGIGATRRRLAGFCGGRPRLPARSVAKCAVARCPSTGRGSPCRPATRSLGGRRVDRAGARRAVVPGPDPARWPGSRGRADLYAGPAASPCSSPPSRGSRSVERWAVVARRR